VLVAVEVLVAATAGIVIFLRRDRPERHADAVEHFKYGSIGAEARAGIPLLVWKALPVVFADLLPPSPDPSVRGWARLGFVFEPGHDRPIGTSVRQRPFPLVGLNCASCHTGTVRLEAAGPPRVILGMGAQQFDPQGFVTFLRAAGADPRFTPDTLMTAIAAIEPDLSLLDRLLYRYLLIPATRRGIKALSAEFAWADGHTRQGPGRVDTFNPYKALLGLDLASAAANGAADLPPVFAQRKRQGLALHWDGNNDSLDERNISAAIGAGATADSLDHESLRRVAEWLLDLPPPAFPPAHIDRARAARGAGVYASRCASCHAFDGVEVGHLSPIAEVGTDRGRLDSFTAPLAKRMNTLGSGRPWRFSHFRKTEGYANLPLDGVWLRAPYLHNGAVPSLRALLFPEERPVRFGRGGDQYDTVNVGFATVMNPPPGTFVHDTTLPGNGNGGHMHGTDLPADSKLDLIEYLKTL
jgi:mono/diheme cytochrome c family protein